MKYRSRFEIVEVMLQSAVGGATKTRLMYEAFLSHNQMVEYLDFLLSKQLLSLTPDQKHYAPTEKGMRFLVMYAEIKDAVNIGRSTVLALDGGPAPDNERAVDNLTGQGDGKEQEGRQNRRVDSEQ